MRPQPGQTMGTPQALLWIEKEAIEAAIEAGRAAARFNRLKKGDSEEALKALTAFGWEDHASLQR